MRTCTPEPGVWSPGLPPRGLQVPSGGHQHEHAWQGRDLVVFVSRELGVPPRLALVKTEQTPPDLLINPTTLSASKPILLLKLHLSWWILEPQSRGKKAHVCLHPPDIQGWASSLCGNLFQPPCQASLFTLHLDWGWVLWGQ